MTEKLIGGERPFVERKIGEGRTAEIIQISETEVLKLFYPDHDQAFIRHEFEVSGQVAKHCDFAPEVFSMDIRGNRTGIRLELIEGSSFLEILRHDPFAVKDLGGGLGVMHRDIHSRQWGRLPEGSRVFSSIVHETSLIRDVDKPAFLQLVLDRSRETLCHGDFHPFNVIYEIAPNKKERFRVFDWCNAYIGHPLSDVARTLFLLNDAALPRHASRTIPLVLRPLFRRLIIKGYLRAYFGAAPVPWELLAGWGVLVRIMRLEENMPGERRRVLRGIRLLTRMYRAGRFAHPDKRI